MASSKLEALLDQLRQLFATEYARGEQDAISRIVQAAQGQPKHNGHDAGDDSLRRDLKKGGSGRAPRGAVGQFIDRVLSERGLSGATSSEIFKAAKTPTEKMCSYSGVRFTLSQGKDKGRYRNKDGKWFLRREKETAGSSANP
jgi:hypothetical protein